MEKTIIVRIYDEAENPRGDSFPGVPLRDLSDAEYQALPAWVRASVDAASFYRPAPARAPRAKISKE